MPVPELVPDSNGPPPSDEPPPEGGLVDIEDRLIDVTRRFLHAKRREWNHTKLYMVDGQSLGVPQVDALQEVVRHGRMRMNQLAARLRLDPSTVTRATNPLVDMELLERSTDPANRRYVILRSTPAGEAAVGRFVKERRRMMQGILGPMDPARRLLLVELFEEYTSLLEHGQAKKENVID